MMGIPLFMGVPIVFWGAEALLQLNDSSLYLRQQGWTKEEKQKQRRLQRNL